MHLVRTALTIAVLTALTVPGPADAQQKQSKSERRPIIITDPSFYRGPPPAHQRNYVGPGPTVVPPMERIPSPAPLAQPPIR